MCSCQLKWQILPIIGTPMSIHWTFTSTVTHRSVLYLCWPSNSLPVPPAPLAQCQQEFTQQTPGSNPARTFGQIIKSLWDSWDRIVIFFMGRVVVTFNTRYILCCCLGFTINVGQFIGRWAEKCKSSKYKQFTLLWLIIILDGITKY